MDETYLNDPRFRRSIILYEFRSGKPGNKCFNSLRKRMGPDFVIERREFDFWFQRFESGSFDIDYDMSLKPKTRQLTDMPIEIFKNITSDLEPFNRLVLRKVCKAFRTVVDSWDPKLEGTSEFVKKITISVHNDVVRLKFNRSHWSYRDAGKSCAVNTGYGPKFAQEGNYHDVATDDLLSILCHPKLKLTSFVIDTPYGVDSEVTEEFAKKLVQRMETCTHRPEIHSQNVDLSCTGSIEELKILKFFKAGTVKNLKIGYSSTSDPYYLNKKKIESVAKEIEGLELWETLEVTFLPSILDADENFSLFRVFSAPKMTLKFLTLFAVRFRRISKILLEDPSRLQLCELEFKTAMAIGSAKEFFERRGATPSADSYKFPIPNSDNFLKIKITAHPHIYRMFSVLIERKQNISE